MGSNAKHGAQNYTLYHHPYSVCSIMVRYALAVAGQPRSPDAEMRVEEKEVNIFKGDQLNEDFLTKINHKGLVPVLASPALSEPMPESTDITFYIADRYPQLSPAQHQREIESLMGELHSLNYFSLSFGSRPQQAKGMLGALDERLMGQISGEYRKALEYKRSYTVDHKINGVRPDDIAQNQAKTVQLMKKLDGVLQPNKPWLFGLEHPTALDTHLVVFIARMKDVGRSELIPERLSKYHERAAGTDEFKKVMGGRKTMIDP